MRVFARLLWHDKTSRAIMVAAGILHVAIWGILGVALPRAAFLPLAYNVEVGINWTGPWWYAGVLPLLGMVFLLVNGICASFMILRERSLCIYLTLGALITQGILLAAAIALVLVNYS